MQTGSWHGGDFNGDGKDDLVHLCCTDYGHVWLSAGGTHFGVTSFSPWPGYNLHRGRWGGGYFNSDGRRDFLHMCCDQYAHLWLGVPP
jgi:hypothetical protein